MNLTLQNGQALSALISGMSVLLEGMICTSCFMIHSSEGYALYPGPV